MRNPLDYIFPDTCAGCSKLGTCLCNDCLQLCDCIGPLDSEIIEYSECKAGFVATYFSFPITKVIHELKYKSIKRQARTCSHILLRCTTLPKVDYIVPVPLHKHRKLERGFNQSLEIAKVLSTSLSTPTLDCLLRSSSTSAQAKLAKKDRLENLLSVVEVDQKARIYLKKASVIILDDVITTGSTIKACALALKKTGVKTCYFAAVAHG